MPADESVTVDEERIKEFLRAFPREFKHLGPQEQLLSAGIYRLLAKKAAQVESVDPVTKEIIQLTVSPERVVAVEPRNAVTSFMIPRADEMRSDVIKSFCHYLHFFTSRETAEKWVSASEKKADLVILSLVEAYRIGVEKNRLQYGETMGAPAADAVA